MKKLFSKLVEKLRKDNAPKQVVKENNDVAAEELRQIKKTDRIIEVKNITKVFDGVTVIDDLNLAIKRGEFVTLLGPSGCGKTTLLRIIAGFETPTDGSVFIENTDVTNVPPYRRPVNTVFQRYALFPHLNVFKNIAFGLKIKKMDKKLIEQKVNAALKMVGLEGYGYRDVSSLSGGQQQRVAIARALVCEPKVLLLDEPLGALDLKMRKEMQEELMAMHKRLGITFIYVTHDQEEALTMSDTVVVINDGVIQQIGAPKKIYDEPANAFVADFIGESNIVSGIMVKDFCVSFLGGTFECVYKCFAKNEKVDLVIRPEDISVYPEDSEKGQLAGTVVSSIFKGTFYQMEILANGYQFTVQSTKESKEGASVRIGVKPDGIHIMKKLRSTNKFFGEVTDENTVSFCGGEFSFVNTDNFEIGAQVIVQVNFDAVELTDDEEDGVVGAYVSQTLYKGTYYQVQIYTDTDQDFYIDTKDEWDLGDRVGVKIAPDKIKVERYVPEEE